MSETSLFQQELDIFEKQLNSLEEKEEDLLYELRSIAEMLANDFKRKMDLLEYRIEQALDEVSEESKEICGYQEVSDVTRDITIDMEY